jgi:hypothetical protein
MSLILSGTDGLSDVDGTAATPAIRGTDANTGIFFPAADTIAFSEGGVECARFDSSGNFGIGTAGAPLSRLDVAVEATLTRRLLVNYDDSVITVKGANNSSNPETLRITADNIRFNTGTSGSGTERMRIDSSGNVGIGTSSPSNNLEVLSSSNPIIGLTSTASNLYCYYGMTAGTVGAQLFTFGQSYSAVYPAGCTALANNTYGIILNASNATGILRFQTNDTERARIDSSGNLLVGTTNASGTAGIGFKFLPSATYSRTTQVGSTTSNSDTTHEVYSTGASAYRFYVGYGGTVFATSTVITAISDQRLKENVRDIDTGLNSIMSLKPRRFDWKEGKGQDKKDVAGFIAQEFEDVFPECVGVSKAGVDGIEYKNINHETLIPTLVKAIQEQQALITTLTARITALETA